MTETAPLRCAIYTRKSSEEGLEQSFNSLHAQREACEAYVKSQAGEGWHLKRERFDDGGHSGGTINRPALRRLLADVAARRVDVVVVYKVDRLTRSLSDFAKIIEAFDRAKVSFVSITQAFNTTTSMGRLTLNVLLSFAQFEREVTGERIRDKIAASKAKGMWMGGLAPLGYDPPTNQVTRALAVNEAEAQSVRHIFFRYLQLGNLYALQNALADEAVRPKRWGRLRSGSGGRFSRGALQHLLSNRTYLGEITHKGVSHRGRHPPILDAATFTAVQDLLAVGRQRRRDYVPKAAALLLRGLLYAADGSPMEPVIQQAKKKRSYRYYAAASTGVAAVDFGEDDAIRRVPAGAIEDLVVGRLALVLGLPPDQLDRQVVRSLLARVEVHSTTVDMLAWTRVIGAKIAGRITAEILRHRLRTGDQVMTEPGDGRLVRIRLPVRLKMRGGRTWITGPDGAASRIGGRPDKLAISRLRQAHDILRTCGAHPDSAIDQLRRARAPATSYAMAQAKWAFLAPDIQRGILEGRLSDEGLISHGPLPLLWSEQRMLLRSDVGVNRL